MKYKTLVVSGCSFTHQRNGWAEALANKYNLNLINLAWCGAGNRHIANSIILYLERNNLNVNDTLVGVMWSGLGRIDFISSTKTVNNWNNFKYDNYNTLVMSGDALNKYKLNDSMLASDPNLELLEIAYSPGMKARNTISWLAINHLNSYLTCKKYNYFQTSFYDYTADCPKIKNIFKGVNYIDRLSGTNLTIDTKNWLKFDHLEYLGNYAYANKLLDQDDSHPSPVGAQQWASQCLIPALTAQGYI